MNNTTFFRGILVGLVGGLVGMLAMYLFGAFIFIFLGWPASTSFKIIGDSAAAFFSRLGTTLPGGVPLGVLLYCLIGLSMGAILGIAVISFEPLRLDSIKKGMGLGVLFVEAMALPLLLAGALSLKMSAEDIALWFSISFVMHLVYGLVLGMVLSYFCRIILSGSSPQHLEQPI